ncbi:hypothetical protein CBL_20858 [Carabus blaptoides fortunei]
MLRRGRSAKGQSPEPKKTDPSFKCECGKSYDNRPALRQHQKRYCLGPNPDFACKICGPPWETNQSLGQHMRQAHPTEYNDLMKAESGKGRNRLWSEQEVKEMARAEVYYEGSQLNNFLVKLTDRTLDSAKGRRKRNDYKELVKKLADDREQGPSTSGAMPVNKKHQVDDIQSRSDIRTRSQRQARRNEVDANEVINYVTERASKNNDLDEPTATTSLDENGLISGNYSLIVPTPTAELESIREEDVIRTSLDEEPNDQVADYIRMINRDTKDDEVKHLTARILNKIEVQLNMLYDRILEVSGSKKIGSRSTTKKRKTSGGKKTTVVGDETRKKRSFKETKRTNKYKLYTRLFQENRRRLADIIWDNNNEEETMITPNITEIEDEYQKIFNSPSDIDDEPVTPVDAGMDCSYMPITITFLEEFLRTEKSSAPGPDKITLAQVRKIDIQLISLFMNTMFVSGVIPNTLRKCRTTLIPKDGDLSLVKNWRPITIKSCILRTFNKILATRLGKLKLHHSQKGFRSIDGCLANLVLVQHIIKEHREAARPYNVLTIDLKKAFDSVKHSSISRTLVRVGVDKRTSRLIRNQYVDITTLGLRVNETGVATIAYADDLILMSGNKNDAKKLLDDLICFLTKRGLTINPAKCTAVTTERNLSRCNDPFTNAVLSCNQGLKTIARTVRAMRGKETKEIIERHHALELEKSYSEGAMKEGFTVHSEPHIRGEDGILKKPDLLLVKNHQLTVINVGIHWEGPNALAAAYQNKLTTYTTPAFLNEMRKKYVGESVSVMAFIVGARGVWCPRNNELCALINLTDQQMFTITADVLKGSVAIHKDFGTRVWSGGTGPRKKL